MPWPAATVPIAGIMPAWSCSVQRLSAHRRASRAPYASVVSPSGCQAASSVRRPQPPLTSLAGWLPAERTAPSWQHGRGRHFRAAARLRTLDDDDEDDVSGLPNDEEDEDEDDQEEGPLDDDDEDADALATILPPSRGPRGKDIDLDEDLGGLPGGEAGDVPAGGDILGDRGLDDLIGAGFSPDSLQGILEEEADSGSEADEDIDEDAAEPEVPSYPEPPERSSKLGDLFQQAGLGPLAREQLTAEQLETVVYDIQYDPRKVDDGCLYVCMEAETWDGHDFTECSVENGAAAFVATRQPEHGAEYPLPDGFPVLIVDSTLAELGKLSAAFSDHPSEKLAVVGITGSAGKTTTSWLVRGIFEELGQLTGMLGSIEYAISADRMTDDGDLWRPLEEDPTLKRDCSTPDHAVPYEGKYGVNESTPNALAMHKILAGVADRGGASAVIECTTTGLEEGRTDEVNFDVAVFTNLSAENMHDGHGVGPAETLEDHLDIMARLFRRLDDPDIQRAVVNVDDPYADVIKLASLEVPVVTYAIKDRDADVYAEKVKLSPWETDITIRTPLGKLQIITPLIGRQNVYNVLAAVAVGVSLNVNLKAIVAGIEAVDVVPGRTEIIDEGQEFPVIVDSASTPEALSRLLETVREAGARRILTVFGAEGHGDPTLRPVLGEILHYKSDFVFVTNNNPRLETPAEVVAQTTAGFPPHIHEYESLPGRPHWLRDVNAPDLGWPERAEQDAIIEAPDWCERDWRLECQGLFRRFVMEDRFSAIRCAIGTAQPRDAVVIAGKGAEDFQEYGDPETGELLRGWFDDRVEARNALSKLPALEQLKNMDRRELPWTNTPEMRPERIDVLMGCDTRQFKN